jgi:hypothetical protein
VTRHFPPPTTSDTTAPAAILIDAARCWREACDAGDPIQPCLSRTLAAHDCAMLAPVLDSLCLFYESALGRPMAVGHALALSEDEHLLLGLVDGSRPRACLGCAQAAAHTLDCALCSTRIMLALTLGYPALTLQ